MLRRTKKRRSTAALIALALVLCAQAPAAGQETLRIGGVGSALGTIRLVSDAFEKSHPGMKVRVLPSLGSSGGIKAVLDGRIDIALSGRPLNKDEKSLGAAAREYARSPFVFVTSNKNVSGISLREVIDIYEGRLHVWQDGRRIRLVMRPASDTATLILKAVSPRMASAVDAALSRGGMITAVTDQESADTIEKTPGAFGMSTLDQITSEKRHFRVLAFNGVEPSIKSLSTGAYPIFKPVYVITAGRSSPLAHRFIAFLFSKPGSAILSENGNMVMKGSSAAE